MLKTILLIALCGPMVWIACRDIQDMVAAANVEGERIKRTDDPPKSLDLLESNTGTILESAGSLRSMLFGLDDPDEQTASTELARALVEHEKVRKRAHELVAKMQRQAEVTKARDQP